MTTLASLDSQIFWPSTTLIPTEDGVSQKPPTERETLCQASINRASQYSSAQIGNLSVRKSIATMNDVIMISSDDESDDNEYRNDSELGNNGADETLPSMTEIVQAHRTAHDILEKSTGTPCRILDVATDEGGTYSHADGQSCCRTATATASPSPSVCAVVEDVGMPSTESSLLPTTLERSDDKATTLDNAAKPCEPSGNSAAIQSPNQRDDRHEESNEDENPTSPNCNVFQRDETPLDAPEKSPDDHAINGDGDGDIAYIHSSMHSGYKRRQLRRQARNDYTEQALSDTEDDCMPKKKRQQAASSTHRKRRGQYHDASRGTKLEYTKQRPRSRKIPTLQEGDGSRHATIASYEEWLLSDAVLKCVRDNGTATFQLQFAWATTACMSHSPQDTGRRPRQEVGPQITTEADWVVPKPDDAPYRSGKVRNVQKLKPSSLSDDTAVAADIYQMESILARWGKNLFFLRWSDGTTGWEPRRHVLDKQMLRDFEQGYQGFDDGIDIVDTRTRAGKCQYLIRWQGRPTREDSWVYDKKLSPKCLERIRHCVIPC